MPLGLNLFSRRPGFDGGLFLADHKAVTARRPSETLPATGTLNLPLTQRGDIKTNVVATTGQRLLGGELIAAPTDPAGIGIHAPTSGAITGFSRAWSAHDGFLPSAIFEPDGRDERVASHVAWDEESIVAMLSRHSVMCCNPRKPAHVVVREAVAANTTTLIINGMETEPYLTADLRALVELPGRMVDVACEIADAIGASRLIIAIPDRHRRVFKRIAAESIARFIEVIALPDKYPQCHPIILAKTLLDVEIAPSGSTLDFGVLVLSPGALRPMADAIFNDRPMTHVVISVAGDAVVASGTYRVPIGMDFATLGRHVGLNSDTPTYVVGGPFTGIHVPRGDAVVTSSTTAVLFFQATPRVDPTGCVHCGWCVEDCPVGISPVELAQLELQASCPTRLLPELRACIDCGLCTYVCPSRLPLAATIKHNRDRFATGVEGLS